VKSLCRPSSITCTRLLNIQCGTCPTVCPNIQGTNRRNYRPLRGTNATHKFPQFFFYCVIRRLSSGRGVTDQACISFHICNGHTDNNLDVVRASGRSLAECQRLVNNSETIFLLIHTVDKDVNQRRDRHTHIQRECSLHTSSGQALHIHSSWEPALTDGKKGRFDCLNANIL